MSEATIKAQLIIRGYDVDEYTDGHCIISRNGKIVDTRPSIASARATIDQLKNAEYAAGKS